MKCRIGTSTVIGARETNQDALLAMSDAGLFAVADGVGGEPGGELASRIAIQALSRFFAGGSASGGADPARMDLAFRLARREVIRQARGERARMGTTLVALRLCGEGRGVVAHVGDSRAYRCRDGELARLTTDHSMREEWLEAVGTMDLLPSRLAEALTRAIAPRVDARPDLEVLEVRPGDVDLLCSDGVSKPLDPERIAAILAEPPEGAADTLTRAAMGAGGHDNATAVVVRIDT